MREAEEADLIWSVLGRPGLLVRQSLIENDAERVDVAPVRDLPSLERLRSLWE